MKISGHITEGDDVRANFVHLRPRPALAILGIAVAILVLTVAAWAAYDAAATGRRVLLAPFLVAVLVYLAGHFLLYLPWRARRTYRQYKALSLPFVALVADDGIRFESKLGSGILPWHHIHRWREGKSMFHLYPTDVAYHIIPKSAFPPKLVEEFRAMLTGRIGPAA